VQNEQPHLAPAPFTIDAESEHAGDRYSRDYLGVTIVAAALSVAAFFHFWRSGELLLYGDAVAHMNIARRFFDSLRPGLAQLGTVWLPLPHLLMLPLVVSDRLWQSGVGGAVPSMLAYVFGVIGIFRLTRTGFYFLPNSRREARYVACFAALVYALNPNLLYLQATAMTETLFLAIFIWATVFVLDFRLALLKGDDRCARRALYWCGLCLCLGILTRYDGWFLSAVYSLVLLLSLLSAERRSALPRFHFVSEQSWRSAILTFAAMVILPPVTWFIYNQHEFKDPLAFARGPYSARAIEAKSRKAGDPHHPGWNAPTVAATFFVKSAELNVAATERSQRTWLYAGLLGSVMLIGYLRPLWPWLLLWIPVPFYAISIAWGGVPIFMPVWWPHSYYNVRYGTQLLPAFVVFGSLIVYLFLRRFSSRSGKRIFASAAVVFVGWSYLGIWREVPICLREARVNSVGRIVLESQLAPLIATLPPDATVLMYIGQHGGALQQIAFPFRRTINESHKRYWYSALMDPARMADYIVATDGDPVAEAVQRNSQGLQEIATFSVPREQRIRIYRSELRR
jgi:hypothetical protein